jgi:hypothetical protein
MLHPPTLSPEVPARVANAAEAQRRHPGAFSALVPALQRADPLADALVAWAHDNGERPTHILDEALALRRACTGPHRSDAANALVDQLLSRPAWVDMARVDAGGAALRRAALTGGLVLAFRSLISGYAAPAGNKPLAFSGRLEASAARRLDETGRFVRAVSQPRGLLPGGEGFILTAKVRLMHAGVRRLLHTSGRWDQAAWSTPINQHDMVATILLFSSMWLGGCRALGVDFTADEAADHMHLWRYVGVLMGVEEALLPHSEAHAEELQAFIRLTQHAPDDDSRRLAQALMQPPPPPTTSTTTSSTSARTMARRWVGPLWRSYLCGLCHVLLDDELCAGLGIASSPTTAWIRRASALRLSTNKLAHASPTLERLAAQWGERYWQESVGRVAGTLSHDYATPTRLGGG